MLESPKSPIDILNPWDSHATILDTESLDDSIENILRKISKETFSHKRYAPDELNNECAKKRKIDIIATNSSAPVCKLQFQVEMFQLSEDLLNSYSSPEEIENKLAKLLKGLIQNYGKIESIPTSVKTQICTFFWGIIQYNDCGNRYKTYFIQLIKCVSEDKLFNEIDKQIDYLVTDKYYDKTESAQFLVKLFSGINATKSEFLQKRFDQVIQYLNDKIFFI